MTPPSALEGLSDLPVSQQLREAAADLGFRIAHGEYDDVDDYQRADLQSLAQMLVILGGPRGRTRGLDPPAGCHAPFGPRQALGEGPSVAICKA